jgi:hypothetical protein
MKIGKAEISGGPNVNFWFVTALVACLGFKALFIWVGVWLATFIVFVLYFNWGRNSVDSECLGPNEEVAGSNPAVPTT